jgi:uncharacterized protein YggE
MEPNSRVVIVEGVGVEPVANDECTLSVVLRVTREHAADAMNEIAALAAKVVDAVRDAGVPGDRIHTTSVSVQDSYDQQGQRVTGQQASYGLGLVVPTLAEVGTVLQRMSATARNALQVQGISLAPSDAEPGRIAARARAVQDAQARADQLATAAGVQLGPLLSIEEHTLPIARPFAASPKLAMAASAPMPIEGGTQDVAVRVVLTYALAD